MQQSTKLLLLLTGIFVVGLVIVLFGDSIVFAATRAFAATPSEAGEIEIVMRDYEFSPNVIRVKAGQQIRIKLRNEGLHTHEFMLGKEIHRENDVTEPPSPDFFAGLLVEVTGSGMPMGFEGMEGMEMAGMDMGDEHAEEEHATGEMVMEDEHQDEHAEGEMAMEGDHQDEHAEGEMAMDEEHQDETMDMNDEHAEGEMAMEDQPAEGEMVMEDEHQDEHAEGEMAMEGDHQDEHAEGEMAMEDQPAEGDMAMETDQAGAHDEAGMDMGDEHDEGMDMAGMDMGEGARVVVPGAHTEPMDMGHMDHHGGMVMVDPAQESTIVLTIPEDRVGVWTFGCFQEEGLHFDDGMQGVLIVEP